ncbi:MAG: discoidin domain-containing protein [Clostridia bacterium]|nr:discoidin domain-containing protein [Clostridia bacterium]
MKTKSIVLLIAVLCVFIMALSSCDLLHEHTWVDADCTTPKTCSECGMTEGEPLGHTEETVKGEAPTCTSSGSTDGKKCSVCGEVLVAQTTIDPLGHKDENTDHACDNGCDVYQGEHSDVTTDKDHLCDYCNQPASDHDYGEGVVTTEPKCEVKGVRTFTCNCGDSYTEDIDALVHKDENTDHVCDNGCDVYQGVHSDVDTDKDHLCDYGCQKEASKHSYTSEETKAPTCTETGIKTYTCNCGDTYTDVIPSSGHKDDNGDYKCDICKTNICTEHTPAEAVRDNEKAPTCTAEGSYDSVIKCSKCGEEISRETKPVQKLPHTEEIVPGVSATCTSKGLTEGKKCAVCGETLVAQEETEMLPHTEEIVPGVSATCTSKGLTEGKKCAVCGETLVAQEETEMLPHTEEAIPAVSANCTATGLTEGKKCAVCGTVTVPQENVPANGHKWDAGVDSVNKVTHTCEVCGICKVVSNELENTENIFNNKQFVGTPEAQAQVLIAGWFAGGGYDKLTDGIRNLEQEGRFSTLLNNTTAFMDATIDLGESYVLDTLRFYLYDRSDSKTLESKKADIGRDILIQVYSDGKWYDAFYCKDNASLSELLTVVDGLDNDYLEFSFDGIVAEKIRFYISGAIATTGITFQEIECSGALLVEHVHTEEIIPGKEATCLQSGLTDGVKCTVCGEVLKEQWVINSNGAHTWDAGVTENGKTTVTCEVCGLTKVSSESFTDVANIFAGKEFVPTDAARAEVLAASWWKGGGYEDLTDGIRNADNAPGRFSTKMSISAFMDSTLDLGGATVLNSLKFYIYEPAGRAEDKKKASVGTDILIQVYADGEWKDVVFCPDNASVCEHLVIVEGEYNDYLEFNLDGVVAEKVRFYISGAASSDGISFEEIECSAKAESAPDPIWYDNLLPGKALTPSEDAAGNIYSASFGYNKINDGDLASRFSSKKNGGKVEATVDLGAECELHEFRVLLYDYNKSGFTQFGTGLQIYVLVDGEWTTVINATDADFKDRVNVVGDQNWLTFDLNGASATAIRFTIPSHGSTGWTTFWEMECSGYVK